MRLLITFDHEPGLSLPINYRHLISSWMYHTMERSDSDFSAWLHERGYDHQGRRYKLFTFGQLQPERFEQRGSSFILAQPPTRLVVSFMADEMAQHLIMGMFQSDAVRLGSAPLFLREARMLPAPALADELELRLLTPLCLSRSNPHERYAEYLSPEAPDYGERLVRNLLAKYHAWQGLPAQENQAEGFDWRFELLTEPRSRLHSIRDVKVKGYTFNFSLKAPPELLHIGYFAGFGEKNAALGFGLAETIKSR